MLHKAKTVYDEARKVSGDNKIMDMDNDDDDDQLIYFTWHSQFPDIISYHTSSLLELENGAWLLDWYINFIRTCEFQVSRSHSHSTRFFCEEWKTWFEDEINEHKLFWMLQTDKLHRFYLSLMSYQKSNPKLKLKKGLLLK